MSNHVVSKKILKTFGKVISEDMALLSTLHDSEPDEAILKRLYEDNFPKGLGLQLITEQGEQTYDFMKMTLEMTVDEYDQRLNNELAADYASIYLNYGIQASPLESVWIDEENLTCQESMFQVRSWYQRYNLGSENWRVRPDDHLVLQLLFLSHLFSITDTEKHLREAAQFMDEHLLRWIGSFSERVTARCSTPYFAGIAMLTNSYCEELRDLMARVLDEPRPTADEIEERMKPSHPVEEVPVSFVPGVGPAV